MFPGVKEGDEARRETRKEGEDRTRGRKARKEGNIALKCGLWGSKMHPKKAPKKEPKKLPNLCLEASGRPLASLGALGGAKADF